VRASDAPDDSGEHRPGTERDRFAMALPPHSCPVRHHGTRDLVKLLSFVSGPYETILRHGRSHFLAKKISRNRRLIRSLHQTREGGAP
jgi:hypothetical protein